MSTEPRPMLHATASRRRRGFWDRYVAPKLIDCACGLQAFLDERVRLVPQAQGTVLEIGVGLGRNLPFYDAGKVTRVIGIDPVDEMMAIARRRSATCRVRVDLVSAPWEQIPLTSHSVDTVLMTFTLCTIGGTLEALAEMRRVLKPGGRLLFCEHGKAPDPGVARWQERLNPLWQKIAGGCNLTRDVPALLLKGGFKTEWLGTGYLPTTPRFIGFRYRGQAVPA